MFYVSLRSSRDLEWQELKMDKTIEHIPQNFQNRYNKEDKTWRVRIEGFRIMT